MSSFFEIVEPSPVPEALSQDHIDAQYPDRVFFEYREKFVHHLLIGMRDYAAKRAPVGMRCLDMGSNTGRYTRIASDLGFPVEGVDFSEEMLALARSRHPDLTFHQGDAQALPFENETFEAVVSLGLIQMVPDWARAVSETIRILKPGGMAVIETNRRFPVWEYWLKHGMYLATGGVGADERRSVLRAHRMGPAAPNGSLRKFSVHDLMNALDGLGDLEVQIHDPRKHGIMHDFVFAVSVIKHSSVGEGVRVRTVCADCRAGIATLST